MSWIAAAVVGSAVVGGAISANASGKASDAQQASAAQANQTTIDQAAIARADQKPWLDAGTNALTQLTARTQPGGDLMRPFGMSDFQQDPGYQFRMDEGMKGVTNSAAARGGLLSGAAMKAMTQYNQNFASNEYGNAYNRYGTNQTNQGNRLASIAGLGQTAANQNSQNALMTGQNVSANQIGAGNARASGYIGQGNAATGAIGQGYNMFQGNRMMDMLSSRGDTYANRLSQSQMAGYGANTGFDPYQSSLYGGYDPQGL